MNCDKTRGHAIIVAILGGFIDPKASQITIFANKQLVAIDKQAGYTYSIIIGTYKLYHIILNVKIVNAMFKICETGWQSRNSCDIRLTVFE